MYLLKNLKFTPLEGRLIVEDGIKVVRYPNESNVEVRNAYWGKSKLTGIIVVSSLLSYVNSYCVNNMGDGYRSIDFHVSDHCPENIEGYILFIEKSFDEIKTDGEILFRRYPNEIVVILREGQFVEFSEKKATVVDNKLLLTV